MERFAILALLAAVTGNYVSSIETWRHEYEAGLKAPLGWLSVAGLFWLHEGENRVGSEPQSDVVLPAAAPRSTAVISFRGERVHLQPVSGVALTVNGKPTKGQELQSDAHDHPDTVALGNLSFTIIKRGSRTGVRLRDPESTARRQFSGLHWYPINEKYRIQARWHAYNPPHKIAITNVLGMTEDELAPGYAEFELAGKTWKLEPTIEDDTLFFTFKDQTAGKETYPSGRFLNTPMPKDGKVEIDFNKAHNPPCAFTSFATCPLPPKQNTIGAAIPAGERKYGQH